MGRWTRISGPGSLGGEGFGGTAHTTCKNRPVWVYAVSILCSSNTLFCTHILPCDYDHLHAQKGCASSTRVLCAQRLPGDHNCGNPNHLWYTDSSLTKVTILTRSFSTPSEPLPSKRELSILPPARKMTSPPHSLLSSCRAVLPEQHGLSRVSESHKSCARGFLGSLEFSECVLGRVQHVKET